MRVRERDRESEREREREKEKGRSLVVIFKVSVELSKFLSTSNFSVFLLSKRERGCVWVCVRERERAGKLKKGIQ